MKRGARYEKSPAPRRVYAVRSAVGKTAARGGLILVLILFASAALTNSAFAQSAPPFFLSQAVNYQPGSNGPSSVFLADVNGDHNLDVVVANQYGGGSNGNGSVSVFLGNGNGTLQPPVTYESGGPGAVSVFVINLHGGSTFPDIVVANQGGGPNGDGSVSVLLNKGDGTFQAATTYDSGGPGAISVAVADVNGDGLPDIVVANTSGEPNGDGSVGVLLNNANQTPGTFSPAVIYDAGGVNATAVAATDVNGDGYPDILVATNNCTVGNCSQGGVIVLPNDTTGAFPANLSTSYLTPGPATSIALGDVNGDGITDVFVGLQTYGAGFLLGNGSGAKGNGTFQAYQAVQGVQGQVVSVAVQDVDGDSINDLLVGLGYCQTCDMALDGGVAFFKGQGSGAFSSSPSIFNTGGNLPQSLALGTLAGSGNPDLVIANLCDNYFIGGDCGGDVAVLRNSVNTLTTTLTSSANPVLAGQQVTYTATVSKPGNAPMGTVTFRDGSTVLVSGVSLSPVQVNGQTVYQAVYSTTYATAGTHQITATYSLVSQELSLDSFSQFSLILTENVLSPTSTGLVSSSPTSVVGQPVTFFAAVASSYGSIPDGDLVTFYDSSNPIGTGMTIGGVATFTTSMLSVGSHMISATYAGDATFASSPSGMITQTESLINISGPAASFSTATVGFNGDTTATETLTLTDVGGAAISFTGPTIVSAGFAITKTVCSTGNLQSSLPSGAWCTLSISYDGSQTNGKIVFTDNATLSNPPSVQSSTYYTQTIALSGLGATGPQLSAPLATVSITDNESITVTDTATVPDVSQNESIAVTDTPMLVVEPAPLTVVAPVAYYSVGSLGFNNAAPGPGTTQSFTLSNIGQAALSLSSVQITQGQANFSVSQIACTNRATSVPVNLQPEDACIVTVAYLVSSATPGAITFTDNASLSNVANSGSAPNYTQTIALDESAASTAAPPVPSTTVSVMDNESIMVTDTATVPDVSETESIQVTDTVTVQVSQAASLSQTITFGPPPSVLVGKTATVSGTASSGLPVTFGTTTPTICSVSGAVATGVNVGSCIVTANQIGNSSYLPAPQVMQTVPVGSTQTITFTQYPTALGNGFTAPIAATASSGLPVILSAGSAACSVSGNTVTGASFGTCTVDANESGSTEYLPAPQVSVSISIKIGQTLSISPTFPGSLSIGATGTVRDTATSGLTVTVTSQTPTICTVSVNTVKGVAAGECAVAFDQAGNAFYAPASEIVVNIPVGTPQTITFGPVPNAIAIGSSGSVTATDTAGLTVVFGTSTPNLCSVGLAVSAGNNNTASVKGLAAGACIVTASQPGNSVYAPAAGVTESVPIGIGQTISFVQPPASIGNRGSIVIAATASSGLPVTLSVRSRGNATCMLSGNTLTGDSVQPFGSCIMLADQSGNSIYAPAPEASVMIPVAYRQALTFSLPTSLAVNATATLSATATFSGTSTGLPITFASFTPSICSVVGTTLTGLAPGDCTVAANVAGGTLSSGAVVGQGQETATTLVGASQTITFGPVPNPIAINGTGMVTATDTAGLPVVFATSTPSLCSIGLVVNAGHLTTASVKGLAAGACVLTADQPGNGIYLPAAEVTQTVPIGVGQTITFVQYPTTIGNGDSYEILATASSGLPVTLTTRPISGPGGGVANCTMTGNTLTINGATAPYPPCVVTANQPGNSTYAPAPPASVSIQVEVRQNLVFTAYPSSLAVGDTGTLTATSTVAGAPTGLAITYLSLTPSFCSVSGTTVTGAAPGNCIVAADAASGTVDGSLRGQAQVTATISVGTAQTITFGPVPNAIAISVSGTVTATDTAGLPVVFATSTPSLCSIGLVVNAGNLTRASVKGLAAGACVVTADQPGNGIYLPAREATQSVPVGVGQTITFVQYPTTIGNGGSFEILATASSGLPVTLTTRPVFADGGTAGCTMTGNTLTINGATRPYPPCVVTANQTGNSTYAPAPPVSVSIQVEVGQNLVFTAYPTSLAVGSAGTLTATSTVAGAPTGLAITYLSLTPSFCTVSGTTVTGVAAGNCIVAADAASGTVDGSLRGQAQATATIPVGVSQTITFGPAPVVLVGGTGMLSATASSGLPVVFGSSTPAICTVSGNIVTGVSVGTCVVTGDQPGNSRFLPAPEVSQSFPD